MVVMVKAGEWGGGTCLCFQGGNVNFMCAYANGQAVQGNWLKVKLVKVLSKLPKVSARKPTEPHGSSLFMYFLLSKYLMKLTC